MSKKLVIKLKEVSIKLIDEGIIETLSPGKDIIKPEPSYERLMELLVIHKNKPHEFVTDVIGAVFWNGRWGSCQYGSAQATFDTLNIMSKYMSQDEIFRALNIAVSCSGPIDKIKALDNIKKLMLLEIMDSATNEINDDYYESLEESITSITEQLNEVLISKSFGEVFDLMHGKIGTLWSAAPTAIKLAFDDFELEVLGHPNENFRKHHSSNLTSAYNLGVGICCWLLMKHGYIQDEKVFSGFDT